MTIKLRSRAGPDGMLDLHLPAGVRNSEVEVEVTVHPLLATGQPSEAERAQWRKFVEETAGKWEGEPLVRAPQGEYEKREELK